VIILVYSTITNPRFEMVSLNQQRKNSFMSDLKFSSLHFAVDWVHACVISGFIRIVDKTCAVLGYHAASSVNALPTFRDNVSVPYSRGKNGFSSWTSWPLKTGPIGCPETSVQNYHSTLRNIPEERRSQVLHYSDSWPCFFEIPFGQFWDIFSVRPRLLFVNSSLFHQW
jgi:hypothetical protein